MKYKLLDCVALVKNLPKFGLHDGDLGTVVAIYEPDGLEVEFVKASGKTQAVLTLTEADVRPTKASQPYTTEEILSFDRIKRAMASRVLDRIEELWQGKQPMSVEQVNEVIAIEWQRVKDAVRSSPAAREAFRKYLERTVSEQIEKLMKKGKAELESLGVVKKDL